MPLQINELGIEFSVGAEPVENSNDNANDNYGCDGDSVAQRAIEDRLVARATARVLLALKAMGER